MSINDFYLRVSGVSSSILASVLSLMKWNYDSREKRELNFLLQLFDRHQK